MTTAFLFPGQDAALERLAPTWYARSEGVRRLVRRAARQADIAVEQVFAAGGRALSQTELLQPVLTAVSLGIHEELLARGIRADWVAGHSLGELAACSAAGCLTPEDAVALAAERGRLMAREAAAHPGGMTAITAGDLAAANEAAALADGTGSVAVAVHNAPDQWVVTGPVAALRSIPGRYVPRPLPVTGAWHSAAMAGAVAEFRATAHRAITAPPRVHLVANRTGQTVADAAQLPDLLAEQFTHPVQWAATMETLAGGGVTDYVTVGPGRVLRGLVRANLGARAVLHAVETPDDLERAWVVSGR